MSEVILITAQYPQVIQCDLVSKCEISSQPCETKELCIKRCNPCQGKQHLVLHENHLQ